MRISDWSSDVCSSDLAAAIAASSSHPCSRAICAAGDPLAAALRFDQVREVPGFGMEAVVGATVYRLGRAAARKSVVMGTSVSVRVDLGGRRLIKNITKCYYMLYTSLSRNT